MRVTPEGILPQHSSHHITWAYLQEGESRDAGMNLPHFCPGARPWPRGQQGPLSTVRVPGLWPGSDTGALQCSPGLAAAQTEHQTPSVLS